MPNLTAYPLIAADGMLGLAIGSNSMTAYIVAGAFGVVTILISE